jgi:hypothetical protein
MPANIPAFSIDVKDLTFTVVITVILMCCKAPAAKEEASSSTPSVDQAQTETPEEFFPPEEEENDDFKIPRVHIEYHAALNDSIRAALETFPPFASVQVLAGSAIRLKDSISYLSESEQAETKDKQVVLPYEAAAYDAILAYRKHMASGTALANDGPGLLQLTRTTGAGDSSVYLLPKAGSSSFLSHGKFFFIGGYPFIEKIPPVDGTYTNAEGNPETRYESSLTENGNFLLTSLYGFRSAPFTVKFGPPLQSYEGSPRDVNGIGSLIHEYAQRPSVFFLTETGLVSAEIISITLKLAPEDLGCTSDQPRILFACHKFLQARDILGVYIPYGSPAPTTCTVTRDGALWTADVNGDGIADFASVSGTFEGISSDTMRDVLWFVNIDGEWKIIDAARELDCT